LGKGSGYPRSSLNWKEFMKMGLDIDVSEVLFIVEDNIILNRITVFFVCRVRVLEDDLPWQELEE
jgi:hypothetical protein